MVTQVLNYHDVQLYDSDVALFEAPQWLNDNAINFYLTYVYHTICLRAPTATTEQQSRSAASDVLLVDPAVVSCMMLQCDDDDEYADLGRGLAVRDKVLFLIPVNDNQSFDGESSHWSLLVLQHQRFVHYDSSAGHNTTAAKKIARTFLRLLAASGVENVPEWGDDGFSTHRESPQQRNGYDCGMFVVTTAEFLCRQHCGRQHGDGGSLAMYVTSERVTALRREIPRIVERLQAAANSGDKAVLKALKVILSTDLIMAEAKHQDVALANAFDPHTLCDSARLRAGLLDTRSYQELEPLQLPAKLRDRITKAQRRAAAEKDGVSLFAANAAPVSFFGNDKKEPVSTSPRQRSDIGEAPVRTGSQRPQDSRTAPAAGDAIAPSGIVPKEKVHLPDVILGHKMREFEAKMSLNALFVDPLENNLHLLSIEDKEKIMLRMQDKIQAIITDVDAHFLVIKAELDAHGIFDSAANHQRAQALCLVELQKRCKMEKLRDEAMREVLDENGGVTHAIMSQMEGKLNSLLAQTQQRNEEDADHSAEIAFTHLQKSTKSFALKRRSIAVKRVLSPVKKTPSPQFQRSNQLCHDTINEGKNVRSEENLESISAVNVPASGGNIAAVQEDWRLRHPHIAHVLHLLATKGGGHTTSMMEHDSIDVNSSRGGGAETGLDDSGGLTVSTLAEDWHERSNSYQIIARRAFQDLLFRFERWRWDSTRQFHSNMTSAFSDSALSLSATFLQRVYRQRSTASARFREEEELQRGSHKKELNADKCKRAEFAYQQLQGQIQAKRLEQEKKRTAMSKRVVAATPRAITANAMTVRIDDNARRAVTADASPTVTMRNIGSASAQLFVRPSEANRAAGAVVASIRRNSKEPARGSLSMSASASAPALIPVSARNNPQLTDHINPAGDSDLSDTRANMLSRSDTRRSYRDRMLPMLVNPTNRRSRMRGDSLIGAPVATDLSTLGHFSNARIEERRASAQTWSWHYPQARAYSAQVGNLLEKDEEHEDDDSDVDDGERRDGMGKVPLTEGDGECNNDDSDGESGRDIEDSDDDSRSIRSSVSSRHPLDSARSSFSIMSKRASLSGEDRSQRYHSQGKSVKSPKRGRSRRNCSSKSPSKRASSAVRGPRGSRLSSRPSSSSTANGSSGGMFASAHFTANAQVLQHRLENIWRVLDFPFSAKLVMLEKYANFQDGDGLSQALTQWEAAVEIVVLREKLKHILVEFKELEELKPSSSLTPAEWSYLLMQHIEIPVNAVNLSSKELVNWTYANMDIITQRCEKTAQLLKSKTGDELSFQGLRYPPRV